MLLAMLLAMVMVLLFVNVPDQAIDSNLHIKPLTKPLINLHIKPLINPLNTGTDLTGSKASGFTGLPAALERTRHVCSKLPTKCKVHFSILAHVVCPR